MSKNKDLFNDKVEISVVALIEIKRAFSVLLDDEGSYVNNVFRDDHFFMALEELKGTYADYFEEPVKKWTHLNTKER
jgi:hypothetical protein